MYLIYCTEKIKKNNSRENFLLSLPDFMESFQISKGNGD